MGEEEGEGERIVKCPTASGANPRRPFYDNGSSNGSRDGSVFFFRRPSRGGVKASS